MQIRYLTSTSLVGAPYILFCKLRLFIGLMEGRVLCTESIIMKIVVVIVLARESVFSKLPGDE